MDITNILRELAALSDPLDDDTQWMTALATDVMERGIVDDEDRAATVEACKETRRIALKIRDLAAAARQSLEA